MDAKTDGPVLLGVGLHICRLDVTYVSEHCIRHPGVITSGGLETSVRELARRVQSAEILGVSVTA